MGLFLVALLVAVAPDAPVPLKAQGVTALDGRWEGRLSDVGGASDEGAWQPVRVPGNFSFQGMTYDGVAWLRQRFTLPPGVPGDFAVRLPMTANAYEVYVNGARVGGRGRIGPDGALEEKDLRGSVFRLPRAVLSDEGPNTLALRVRTFYGNGGVMAPGVLAGPEEAVRDAHDQGIARVAMLTALFLFAGFFHLVLFAGRTRERHYLSFAILSVSLASITAGINTLGYLLTSNPDFNAYLVFVPILVLPAGFILFFSDFFARRAPWLRRVTVGFAGVGFAALVTSSVHHPVYPLVERVVFPLAMALLALSLAISLWWTLQGLRAGQFGARAIVVGLMVYALTGVLELAWTMDLVGFNVDSYIGFAFFIGAMVVAIASRFAWLHRQVERGERDVLTGCLTRHGFTEHMTRALVDHRAPTCIMFDLDHFKRVNDTLGHQAGDRVLTAAGQAVRGALRQTDLVGRWGGEEFLVLLLDHDAAAALEVASRIQAELRREKVEGHTITASFGVATRRPEESIEAWLARADAALYEAKRAGRDCVRAAA